MLSVLTLVILSLGWGTGDRGVAVDSGEQEEKVAGQFNGGVGAEAVNRNFVEIGGEVQRGVLSVSLLYSFGEEVRVEMFDALGRRVHSGVITGPRLGIDVSGFPVGVYFLWVRMGQNFQANRKVVIR